MLPFSGHAYSTHSSTFQKDVNIRVQQGPFLFLPALTDVPLAQVEFMFRPNKHFNLGLVANSYNDNMDLTNSTYALNVNSFGMRVDFVLNDDAFSDGLYISNLLMFGAWTSSEETLPTSSCKASYELNGRNSVAGGSFGYQWFWRNGYNVNIGVAFLESRSLDSESELKSDCDEPGLEFEKYDVIQKTWVDLGFGFAF